MGGGAQSPVEQRIVRQMECCAGFAMEAALGAAQPQADRASLLHERGRITLYE
jgi:hypothetical protein